MKTTPEEIKNNKILYCYNNNNISFDDVVSWFTLYLGYDIASSVILSYIINDHKKAAIYRGSKKELQLLSKILNKRGLKTFIK